MEVQPQIGTINNNFSDVSSQPVIDKPNNPKKMIFITVLAIIGIFFVLRFIAISFIKNSIKVNNIILPSVVVTRSITNKPTRTKDFENWKTYTNTKYRFEVKYNPDLNPTESSGNGETVGQFTYLQKVSFGTGVNSTNFLKSPNGYEVEVSDKSLSDYKTEIIGHIADKIDSEKIVSNNNNTWTKINYKIFLTTDFVSLTKVVSKHNEYVYALTALTADIDQILSTFRFLDQPTTTFNYQSQCESFTGGKWLDEYRECENISPDECGQMHGTYENCASACRYNPKAENCTENCVRVCIVNTNATTSR